MARKTANKTKRMTRAAPGKKPTGKQVASTIRGHHARFVRHIHAVLTDAGLKGVKVRGIRFSVASNAFAGGGCVPPCPPGQQCVLDSSGGTARWVCSGG
jgi:hypothetical protein